MRTVSWEAPTLWGVTILASLEPDTDGFEEARGYGTDLGDRRGVGRM